MTYRTPLDHVNELVARPRVGSMPKDYLRVCNTVIDQGWTFIEGRHGRKHKLLPPNGDRPKGVPCTPSDSYFGFTKWITDLRRSGAQIDTNGNPTVEPTKTVSAPVHDAAVLIPVDTDLQPITTHGAWWRKINPTPVPVPEPEPEPVPAPVAVLTRPTPAWSLAQAREMIHQGYHIRKVMMKTGWGQDDLADLVDETGYVRLTD